MAQNNLNTLDAKIPLVTVITPVYNRATLLDETITSVLEQDYPNLEYIVLDDGSTDDSLNVIKKYRDKVIMDSHSNMGETNTVNKGFAMSKGDIIGVVNSDDPLLSGAIHKIVSMFMSHPELVVVYPDWQMIDLHGNIIEYVKTYDYSYANMLRWHHCMPGPGTFFRREVVDKLGGRDGQFRYVADFDFWLRAGLLGLFARIPETLATFRVHPDSASVGQQGELMAKEHIALIDKIYNIPELPQSVTKLKKEAYSSANFIAGCVCGWEFLRVKLGYFYYAIHYAPLKYAGEYSKRLVLMMISIKKCIFTK